MDDSPWSIVRRRLSIHPTLITDSCPKPFPPLKLSAALHLPATTRTLQNSAKASGSEAITFLMYGPTGSTTRTVFLSPLNTTVKPSAAENSL